MPKTMTTELYKKIAHRKYRHTTLEAVRLEAQSPMFTIIPDGCRLTNMKAGPHCEDIGYVELKIDEAEIVCDICEELNKPG